MSDIEPPSRKRTLESGFSIADGLAIGTISISSRLHVRSSNEIIDSLNRFSPKEPATNTSLGNEMNIFSGYFTARPFGDMTSKAEAKEIDAIAGCGQPLLTPTSVIPKVSVHFANSDATGNKRPFPFSIATCSKMPKKSACIWPTGVSCQADFTEIVVSDMEMNAFWDTLQGIF